MGNDQALAAGRHRGGVSAHRASQVVELAQRCFAHKQQSADVHHVRAALDQGRRLQAVPVQDPSAGHELLAQCQLG